MKKLLGLLVIVAIGYGIWYLSGKTANTPIPLTTKTPTDTSSQIGHPDASNATFLFEDGPVILSKGTNTTSVIPGGASLIETSLTNTIGYGDLNNDGKEDAVVALIQSGGGTGTFIYLAGYVSGTISYKGTNATFIGDRILPKTITIGNGEVTFTYLDRKADEPMDAEPTISAYKTFIYSNGTLKEKN